MATEAALATRYAIAVNRLGEVTNTLQERFAVNVEQQPVTQKDPRLGRIQQIENVTVLLEAILGSVPTPAQIQEANELAEVANSKVADVERENADLRMQLEQTNELLTQANEQIVDLSKKLEKPKK